MIAKGTMVRITTTNGGDITSRLLEAYRPTYDAVIELSGNRADWVGKNWVCIAAPRIKTIEAV